MKKSLLITVALLLMVFLVGCLDYKAYEAPAGDDAELLSEIEQLEKELAAEPETVEAPAIAPAAEIPPDCNAKLVPARASKVPAAPETTPSIVAVEEAAIVVAPEIAPASVIPPESVITAFALSTK